MLGRYNDGRDFRRLAIDIFDRHLALGIGTQFAGIAFTLVPGGGKQFENLVAVIDRRRHQVGGLVAGVAEHDALIACAFRTLLVGGIIHTLGNVRRLEVQEHFDLCCLPVEALLLISDIADCLAGGGLELGGIDDVLAVLVFLDERRRHAHFAGDHDAVGGCQRLAGDAHRPRIHSGLAGFAIDEIDDFIGYPVTDLVRMAFGNGFRGKNIVGACHRITLQESARDAP